MNDLQILRYAQNDKVRVFQQSPSGAAPSSGLQTLGFYSPFGGLATDARDMRAAPTAGELDERAQALAVVGEGVLHLGRDLRVDLAGDNAVALQLAQLRGQHFLGASRDEPLQFVESADFIAEIPQDQHLPSAANHVDRNFDRAVELFTV